MNKAQASAMNNLMITPKTIKGGTAIIAKEVNHTKRSDQVGPNVH